MHLLLPALVAVSAAAAMPESCLAEPGLAEPLPRLSGVEAAGFAVAEAGTTGRIATRAAGAAELTPEGVMVRPMTADTPVRIASISKLTVALAIARLADGGQLRLDDDASRHLGWSLRNPAFPDAPITIRMLLRHESGLSDRGGYGFALGTRLRDQLGAASWSKAPPGTAFDYANVGFPVLGEIIEAVTGERFDRAMQRLVFQPLKLDACFNWSGCSPGRAEAGAVLYRKAPSSDGPWDKAGRWYPQVDAVRPAGCPVRVAEGAACDLSAYVPGTNGGLFGPQGGLRISVLDLARLGQVLARNDGTFLKQDTLEELFSAKGVAAAGQGEETDSRLMQYWSLAGLHCFSGTGMKGGDQPLAPKAMAGCGHLGEAYGLLSALVIDRRAGRVRAQALTGTAEVPGPGQVSRFSAQEEALFAIDAGGS